MPASPSQHEPVELHPEPVEGASRDDLIALHTRLRTTLLECYAHAREPWRFSLVGRNEIDAMNHDLEDIRRINAGLGHLYRSPAVARWPAPVFPPHILHARGDLVSVLQTATRIASTAIHVTAEPTYA